MANFPKMVLTSKGVSLQAKVQGGAQLVLTRMALGDGQLGGTPISGLNALVSQKVTLPLTGGKRVSTQTYQVEAFFYNTTISTGFWWREWGVFATDPGVGEILYCYANAGDAGDYIAPATDTRIEKYLYASMAVGNASNITVEVSSSDIYITAQDLSAHADDTTKHIGTVAKTTPLDADAISLVDSADGSKLKRLTLANLKAALSTVFAALTHSHAWGEITSKPSTFTPATHATSATTYGVGTSTSHGHVKLSDATNSTSGASGATAATPAAVKAAYDKALEALGSKNIKSSRFVVGTSTDGWTTKDCDYLCDGTADEVEINAAIAALPAAGGEVVLLDGTFTIAASIILKTGVSLRGQGVSTVITTTSYSTAKLIANAANATDVRASQMLLNGNSRCAGINFDLLSDGAISSVVFASCNTCIILSNSSRVCIFDCTIRSTNRYYPFQGTNSSGVIFRGNLINGPTTDVDFYHVRFENCKNCLATQNCLTGKAGIRCYKGTTGTAITGNVILNPVYIHAITIDGSNPYSMHNQITNNVIQVGDTADTGRVGIDVSGSYNNIEGNLIFHPTLLTGMLGRGIYLSGSTSNGNRVTNNTISAGLGYYDQIGVYQATNTITAAGNKTT